ncbi:MFS general substrate transporter [Flammula alnicola]|nr:MFS general substrate transporter [Flammula alnicola]
MSENKITPNNELLGKGHSRTESEAESGNVIDAVAEKQLLRKLDWILIPLFMLIYGLNFIDRTAVGNAKIAGLEKDLGMEGFDFNIALTVFYIFYFLADIPSNLIMKRVGSIWIAVLVTLFGAVSLASAFIKTYRQLLATRVLLGLAEGGTLSALVYLMARYYRRKELVLRTGLFFGLAPTLAGAFGGLLASGLLSVDNIGIVKSWRKIFFVEGLITTSVGLLLFITIPDDPLTSRILTKTERELSIARLNADAVVKTDGKKEPTSIKLILQSFNIWTTVCAVAYMFVNISFQGLSLFLPTVVSSLGKYTVVQAQLRSVPPFALATVWVLVVISWSFIAKQRAIPVICTMLLQVVGYAIAVGTKNPHARYAACFLCVTGSTPGGPMFLIWGTDNAAPDTMRAVATAAIPALGAIGSLIAVWTYLPSDAPNFHKGNSLNLATGCTVVLMATFGALYLRRENAKRDRGERDYRLEGKTEEEIKNLGYLHPKFRYQI